MQSAIKDNIKNIRKHINEIAVSCARAPQDVAIIAVSKTVDASLIQEAYDLGLKCFGENRVQELVRKIPALPEDIKWHMIGHLQTNKVKQIISKVEMIESLDRPELYRELEKEAVKQSLSEVCCLIQVNSSNESSKFGFAFDEVESFLKEIKKDSPVKIKGLMTIGPHTEDEAKIREAFRRTCEFRDRLKERFVDHRWDILSMGMSGDYKIAIEEGSTMVRVGSAIFGEREK